MGGGLADGLSPGSPSALLGPKLRNLVSGARRRDSAAMKADTQAIYQAASRAETEYAARAFARRWRDAYPALVTRLRRDRPE